MKFNNRSKKSKENHLGFEDPEGKGSQISKKPKGFGREDPKSPREPLAVARDGVEEKKDLGSKGGAHPPYIGWKL
jgi:hypothetical protein